MRRITALPGVIACIGFLALSLWATAATAAHPKESVLYRFNGGDDGAVPVASMIADGAGNLYGTTSQGGGSANCKSGCGTVFELSPPTQPNGGWSETVLYRFQGGDDGATPAAPMIMDKSGNLYGVTSAGGGDCANAAMSSCGTAFELMPPNSSGGAWTEARLYSFQGNPNGRGDGDLAWPNGLAFDSAGNIYGLAYSGGHCSTDETGPYCSGGAFSLKFQSGAWVENVLYRFKGRSGSPAGPLLDAAGNLYGTAPGGAYGCGGVFRLHPSKAGAGWGRNQLYDFQCGDDGAFAVPGLVFDAAGNLYGMSLGTAQGHASVFELSPTNVGGWSESVLFNFQQPADGYTPSAGPILSSDGRLYGTTQEGGKSNEGTVFQLRPPRKGDDVWSERVLHSFAVGQGGFAPYGRLTLGLNNALYGTTPAGGDGFGTIFVVVP